MLLEVRGLEASYGELKVLWSVDIGVNKGEIVALVGPNGAGKTTLLRTIAGVIKEDKGDILFEGRRINNLPSYERVRIGISLVPEGGELFPYMTVQENLDIGAYLPEARRKYRENLEFVFTLFPRLKERRNQLAGTLSGGERQMLAIGRALMSSPKLMMFDEPSLGLAPNLAVNVLRTIQDLNKEGYTVLLVEQNVRLALRISSRGYVIENGRIVLKGDSKELLENPHVKKAYLGI
ncbi:MAG: ABC transporter ATP-binding protein [Desulfurococcales archaeon ex4484_204]|nr:MAG: ABC transporter ATP-binding protein [Desulfurococcales archaeon ex4484_204]